LHQQDISKIAHFAQKVTIFADIMAYIEAFQRIFSLTSL